MSEAEIFANAPQLGPELTARLLDERQRLQSPDDLAEAKLDSDTLARAARKAGLDPGSALPEDHQVLGALRQRAQQIFASEQRANQDRPLGWEAKQGILKQLVADIPTEAVFRPGDLSNSAPTLQNLLYTRPEGEARTGLVKLLNAAGEDDSESNNGGSHSSNGEDGAGALQVAANAPSPGGTQTAIPPSPPSNSPTTGGYMYIWFDEKSKTHRIIKQGAFDE